MPISWSCGHCGTGVAANPVYADGPNNIAVCPSCGMATVFSPLRSFPAQRRHLPVAHLPADVAGAWEEACGAFGAGAYTAAEIVCRKILMHIAVDIAGSEAGKAFTQYVDDLESAGYITTGLKAKVDSIRQRGNIANHELPASDAEEAEKTMAVTRHLLVSIYELPNS